MPFFVLGAALGLLAVVSRWNRAAVSEHTGASDFSTAAHDLAVAQQIVNWVSSYLTGQANHSSCDSAAVGAAPMLVQALSRACAAASWASGYVQQLGPCGAATSAQIAADFATACPSGYGCGDSTVVQINPDGSSSACLSLPFLACVQRAVTAAADALNRVQAAGLACAEQTLQNQQWAGPQPVPWHFQQGVTYSRRASAVAPLAARHFR